MKLTDKQAAFIREYIIDRNATQAAIRAGYSVKTTRQIGEENLTKPDIRSAVDAALLAMAEKTETEAEWVRKRLREEATDFSEFASHSARIRALELLGKVNGIFEIDHKQKTDPLRDLITALNGKVLGPAKDFDDEEGG